VSTALLYILSTICLYTTLKRLLVLCHCVHCCLLQFLQCLSVSRNVRTVGSTSLCPLQSGTVCPLSISTSHCSVCRFSATMATRAFYSLPTVCQYATLYSLLVFCQCVHCCLLQSATCLLVTHNVPYVGSVPLCPLLFSTLCPLSVSTSQCTVCWFCVAVASFVFYNLSTVCQYLTVYRRLFLCHYVHLSLLQSVNCLSVPHNVPSDCSVTLCPLQSSKVSPFSISTSHCYVCRFSAIMAFSAFYTLPNVCQYLTLYHLLVLCHYVHCCLLHCAKCMSVPHNVPSFGCVLLCQIVFYSPSTDLKYLTIYRLLILCHCALF